MFCLCALYVHHACTISAQMWRYVEHVLQFQSHFLFPTAGSVLEASGFSTECGVPPIAGGKSVL